MDKSLVQILRNCLHSLCGFVSFIYIISNLSFWIIPVILLAVIKLMVPVSRIKVRSYQAMIWIYGIAVKINDFLLFGIMKNKLHIQNPGALNKERNYLILSNHQSWADILILQSFLNKNTPPIRFIVKRELIFMPLIGLICWAYEYPFVRRGSLKSKKETNHKTSKDMYTIRNKIDHMSSSNLSIINFVEGTRFNILKSKKFASRYKHLLNPHAGGLFHILKNYGEKLDTVLNFTIVYGCRAPFFWKFIGGRCRHILVDLQEIQKEDLMTSLGATNEEIHFNAVSNWLKELWKEKDEKMNEMIRTKK